MLIGSRDLEWVEGAGVLASHRPPRFAPRSRVSKERGCDVAGWLCVEMWSAFPSGQCQKVEADSS
jgi:hypothetical protein